MGQGLSLVNSLAKAILNPSHETLPLGIDPVRDVGPALPAVKKIAPYTDMVPDESQWTRHCRASAQQWRRRDEGLLKLRSCRRTKTADTRDDDVECTSGIQPPPVLRAKGRRSTRART